MKLNWITFRVSDLEKSMAFYTELLNLEISAKFGSEDHQIVMLGKANEPKIELIFEPNTKIENPGEGVSIGLEFENLGRLVEILKENGKNVVGPILPNPQIRFFFVQDPDGYTIQLVEQLSSSVH
jgi:lactoylglutathione lyase